jgi:hypothetical protein
MRHSRPAKGIPECSEYLGLRKGGWDMKGARDACVIGAYSTRFGKWLEKSMKDLTRDAYPSVDKFYHSDMAKVLAAYMPLRANTPVR